MKRYMLLGAALGCSVLLFGQAEMDAFRYSQPELKGTARYMSMGGAFGALGGDITTLSQNPGGIGVYRSSEIAGTLNLSGIGTKTKTPSFGSTTENDVRFTFDNIGYVGSFAIGGNSALINFNVGFTYNRQRSYNRTYRTNYRDLSTSLTNYIAAKTNEVRDLLPVDMEPTKDYNPYFPPANGIAAPWLSVLAWNSYLIDGVWNETNPPQFAGYTGFFQPGDYADADMYVRERGRVDEYTFSLGGNVMNVLYWGASLGIVDMNYDLYSYYGEDITYLTGTQEKGQGGFRMTNWLSTDGTGVNFKMGVIAKPSRYLRLGLAFHTPTFYKLTDHYSAQVDYRNLGYIIEEGPDYGKPLTGSTATEPAGVTDYHLHTPWKLMASAAIIVGKKGIISLDYEYMNYNKMKLSDDFGDLPDNRYISEDFKAGHTFRVGAEYRITSQLSARLGYANQLSPVKAHLTDGSTEVLTAGTVTHYTLDRGVQYYTCGLGYRWGSFYTDAAFVFQHQKEDLYPFSPLFLNGVQDIFPQESTLITNTKTFLVTIGFRF